MTEISYFGMRGQILCLTYESLVSNEVSFVNQDQFSLGPVDSSSDSEVLSNISLLISFRRPYVLYIQALRRTHFRVCSLSEDPEVPEVFMGRRGLGDLPTG